MFEQDSATKELIPISSTDEWKTIANAMVFLFLEIEPSLLERRLTKQKSNIQCSLFHFQHVRTGLSDEGANSHLEYRFLENQSESFGFLILGALLNLFGQERIKLNTLQHGLVFYTQNDVTGLTKSTKTSDSHFLNN